MPDEFGVCAVLLAVEGEGMEAEMTRRQALRIAADVMTGKRRNMKELWRVRPRLSIWD